MITIKYYDKVVELTGRWKTISRWSCALVLFECLVPYTIKRRFRSDKVEYREEWVADWDLEVCEETINVCGRLK